MKVNGTSGVSEARRREYHEILMSHYKELDSATDKVTELNERISTLRKEISYYHAEVQRMDKVMRGDR
jgi:uncharacterized protein YlxW (UPF0749 family)